MSSDSILGRIEKMKREYERKNREVDIKFKPVEKPEKAEPKEEPKLTPLMQKLKKRSTGTSLLDSPTPTVSEEAVEVKKEYVNLIENQMKVGNLLLRDIVSNIKEGLKEIAKEEDSYSWNTPTIDARMSNSVALRRERYQMMELTKNQMVKWVQNDLVNHFTTRYTQIANIPEDKIEIIRKMKITETDVTFTTDEGEYTFESSKMGNFGGYLVLRTQVLTEVLDLDMLSSALTSKNKRKILEAEEKTRLLLKPLLIPTPNGKYLMAPLKYLKRALLMYLESASRRKNMKQKASKRLHMSKEERTIQNQLNKGVPPKEVVRGLINLKPPTSSNYVVYPLGYLKYSGIELESDIDFDRNKDTLERLDVIKEDFISWDTVNSNKALFELSDRISAIRRLSNAYSESLEEASKLRIAFDAYEDSINSSLAGKDVTGEHLLHMLSESKLENNETFVHFLTKRYLANEIIKDSDKSSKNAIKAFKKQREAFSLLVSVIQECEKLPREVNELTEYINKVMFYDKDMTYQLEVVPSYLQYDSPTDEQWFKLFYYNGFVSNPPKLPSENESKEKLIGSLMSSWSVTESTEDIEGEEFTIETPTTTIPALDDFHQLLDQTVAPYLNAMDKIESNVRECRKVFNEAFNNYQESRQTIRKIQTLVGTGKRVELENLSLKADVSGYPIDVTLLVLDHLFSKCEGLEDSVNESSKFSLPIPTLHESEYVKVRAIVKKLGDREYVNWTDVLKILLGSSTLLSSRVRLFPEIRELIGVPEVDKDLRRINDLNKFFRPDIEPVTEDEDKFNRMMNDIFTDYKGLICGINYGQLMRYVVEEYKNGLRGEEIVKFIPNVKVVDRYFPIPKESVIYPKVRLSKLVTEIPNLPSSYVALNHILNTVENMLSAEEGLFDGSLDLALKYAECRKRFEIKRLSVPYNQDILDLQNSHDSKVGSLYTLYSKIRRVKRVDNRVPINVVEEEIRKRVKSPVPYNIPLDEAEETGKKLEELLKGIEKDNQDLLAYEVKSKEKLKADLEEISQEMVGIKEQLDALIGDKLNKVVKSVMNFYDLDKSRSILVNAWKFMNFDKFAKGRVLLNYILTLVKYEPPIVQASIFQIIRDFLIDLNTSKAVKDKLGKSEVEKVEYCFQLLAFALKQDRVLKIKSEDLVELTANLEDKESGELTKEEKGLLKAFQESLEGLNDKEVRKAFREFERKDLIDDDLYMLVVYGDIEKLESQYPRWYVREFNVAENLKIMLDCGTPIGELMAEHREDEKLMSIVERVKIAPDYIEALKKQNNL